MNPKSPYDFGAVGDGATDDTAALNAWAQSGGPLVGAPATFRVTGTVLFNKTFTLVGQGMLIEHDTADPNPVVKVLTVDRFIIDGLRINGRKDLKPGAQTAGHGINITDATRFIVRNCHILNTHEHGIACYSLNTTTPKWIEEAIVTDNFFDGVGNLDTGRGHTIWFFGFIRKVTMTGNIGLRSLSGISIDDASQNGPARDARECIMSNNTMHVYFIGCRFESTSTGTISGNIFTQIDNGTFPTGVVVCGMMVRAIQYSVESTSRVAVSGNFIQGSNYGLYIADSKLVTVTGNIIESVNINNIDYGSAAGAAIEVTRSSQRECEDILIASNIIRSGYRGITVSSSNGGIKEVTIRANDITYAGAGSASSSTRGVRSSAVKGVSIQDNKIAGFSIGIEATTVSPASSASKTLISGNMVVDSAAYGISIGNPSPVVVLGNYTTNSGTAGVAFSGLANIAASEFSGNICRDGLSGGSAVTKTYANRTS